MSETTQNMAPAEMSEEDLKRFLNASREINNRFPKTISVGEKKYKVLQISKAIRSRINNLELEAYMLSGHQKEATNLRQARKIQRKLDRLHAKTAAYYLLGNKAVFIPGLFRFTWKKLMRRPEEHIARINDAAINNEELNFSSANWDITSLRLALSMKPVGDSVRETLKRWKAAEQQVNEDATKKKEDAKSEASSKKTRTTRK
ncbi:MAG: hypothetical protein HDS14_00510 [Bacteroides sp.]|nr:hypothetical protein [Bacteroides sp.]